MRKAVSLIVFFALAASLAAAAMAANDEAGAELEKLLAELGRKQKAMPSEEFIGFAERSLLEFIGKYPGSGARGNAELNLAQLYRETGRNGEAIKHLESYLAASYEKSRSDEAAARYTLGDIYLGMEEFDKARAEMEKLASGENVDPRILQVSRMALSRIGTLKKLVVGSPAIDFSATALDGKELTLSKYRGKVVLLDFWATWCSPCRQEMPNVRRVYAEYGKQGFEIVGISLDNDGARLKSYIAENRITWRQVFDGKGWQSHVGQVYAISSIPATFLLDREGKIRFKNLRGKALEEKVKVLLAEKTDGM